ICQAELEALYQRVAQLKALPTLRPPRDRWPAVRAVMNTERVRRRRSWSAWGGTLAAAALLAGILLVQPSILGQSGNLHAELTQAKQQSATLEDSLQQYDVDGRVLSGHCAAVVAELEDRISVIDGSLATLMQRDVGERDGDVHDAGGAATAGTCASSRACGGWAARRVLLQRQPRPDRGRRRYAGGCGRR